MNNELSERQKEIIRASLELIAEKGIQGFTIKNLSKKIGLVESAIYRHYENKTHILMAILDSIIEHKIPENKQQNVDTFTKLEQKFKNHFQKFASSPALVSVVFSEELFQNENSLIEKTKAMMQKSIADIAFLIDYGQKQGELRNDIEAEHLAIIILGTIRMFVKKWKMSDYSFDIIQKGDELINSMKLLLKPL
ncbi:MAG: TetR/AcrR family transcriptional regulator [Bacteroidales bacterium]|jgi:TetR/AcrR family fatty acid metabolism transcriptional regulator|nr:TetR/AcrR family transcriptional regulator [Bacteroidales bacterium]